MPSDSFSSKLCNPFAADVFPDGESRGDPLLTLHHEAQERLEDLIAEAAHLPPSAVRQEDGRVILLKAPRAGYGKSHLISRLEAGGTAPAFIMTLEFDPGQTLTWKSLLDQVLARLHTASPDGSPTWLDLVARRTFAMVNAGMIQAGKIPCADPAAATVALAERAVELFDFARPDQSVALQEDQCVYER